MTAASEECILDGVTLARILKRLAHEVIEAHGDVDRVVLAGIEAGGAPLVRALGDTISAIAGREPIITTINPSEYRDDRPRSAVRTIPSLADVHGVQVDITEKVVILVDDVIQTGRTFRAALDAVTSVARPAAVELLVLIDRGNREIPLRPTYVGKNLPVAAGSWIDVRLGGTGAGAYAVQGAPKAVAK
jgi:pyrimidine operon attenuation protein/uracil phosphoribosyltransferase